MLLLIDERHRPDPPRSRRSVRLPYRVLPSSATAVSLFVVAATTGGATGAFAAMGALVATFRALDRALPYKQGLRDHRQ